LSALAANAITQRAVHYFSLDLDWQGGKCVQVGFDGSTFGAARNHRFTPHQHKH
jgi:hypothetical protein